MKKAVFTLVLAAMIVGAIVIWYMTAKPEITFKAILQVVVLILLVAFALFFGIKRLTSARRGEPSDDELSKRVTQKTAAWSYYISLYLWLGLSFLSDKINLEVHTLFAAGIIGMAVVFACCWLVFNFRGIQNE